MQLCRRNMQTRSCFRQTKQHEKDGYSDCQRGYINMSKNYSKDQGYLSVCCVTSEGKTHVYTILIVTVKPISSSWPINGPQKFC